MKSSSNGILVVLSGVSYAGFRTSVVCAALFQILKKARCWIQLFFEGRKILSQPVGYY